MAVVELRSPRRSAAIAGLERPRGRRRQQRPDARRCCRATRPPSTRCWPRSTPPRCSAGAVKVDVASHSPQVDPLRDDLLAALDGIRPQPAVTPFFSTVTARAEDGPGLGPEYWVRNLRQPVLFAGTVQALLADGYGHFVELSPHPLLLTAVDDTARADGRPVTTVASLRRDADEPVSMLAALGALYVDGYAVDWEHVRRHPARGSTCRRTRGSASATGSSRRPAAAAAPRTTRCWAGPSGWPAPTGRSGRTSSSARDLPSLFEHRIGGRPSAPASALLELMRRAAGAPRAIRMTDVRFERLLLLDDDSTAVQVILDASGTVEVFRSEAGVWGVHARPSEPVAAPCPRGPLAPDEAAIHPDVETTLTGDEVDALLHAAGVVRGPSLRPLDRLHVGGSRATAELAPLVAGGEVLSMFDAGLQAAAVASSLCGVERCSFPPAPPPSSAGRAPPRPIAGEVTSHRSRTKRPSGWPTSCCSTTVG